MGTVGSYRPPPEETVVEHQNRFKENIRLFLDNAKNASKGVRTWPFRLQDSPFSRAILYFIQKADLDWLCPIIYNYVRPEVQEILGRPDCSVKDLLGIPRPSKGDKLLRDFWGVYLDIIECAIGDSKKKKYCLYVGSGTSKLGVWRRLHQYRVWKQRGRCSLAGRGKHQDYALRTTSRMHIRILALLNKDTTSVFTILLEGILMSYLRTVKHPRSTENKWSNPHMREFIDANGAPNIPQGKWTGLNVVTALAQGIRGATPKHCSDCQRSFFQPHRARQNTIAHQMEYPGGLLFLDDLCFFKRRRNALRENPAAIPNPEAKCHHCLVNFYKCDRGKPCGRCLKSGDECYYPSAGEKKGERLGNSTQVRRPACVTCGVAGRMRQLEICERCRNSTPVWEKCIQEYRNATGLDANFLEEKNRELKRGMMEKVRSWKLKACKAAKNEKEYHKFYGIFQWINAVCGSDAFRKKLYDIVGGGKHAKEKMMLAGE